MVRNPFAKRQKKHPLGFIYIADEKQDLRFATAQPGDVIRNPTRDAPWLVVDHAMDGILLTAWPGMLWEVEAIDPVEPQNHTGNYTRTVAIQLVRRLPTHILFGANGEGVAWVMDHARELTRDDAERLSNARDPRAGELCARAWLNWDGLAADQREYSDWEGIIGIGKTPPYSPVNRGLSAVFNCICARALEIDGDEAWYADGGPPDDPDMHLVQPWAGASLSLIEAALMLGAPHLLPDADREVLTAPWRALTRPGLS